MNQHEILSRSLFELIWGNCFSKRFGKLDFFIGKMQKKSHEIISRTASSQLILKKGFVTF